MSDNIYPFPAGRHTATRRNRSEALLAILVGLRDHFAQTQPIKILSSLMAIRLREDSRLRIDFFLDRNRILTARVLRDGRYLFVARMPFVADATPIKPTRWERGWEGELFDNGWRSYTPDPASFALPGYVRKNKMRKAAKDGLIVLPGPAARACGRDRYEAGRAIFWRIKHLYAQAKPTGFESERRIRVSDLNILFYDEPGGTYFKVYSDHQRVLMAAVFDATEPATYGEHSLNIKTWSLRGWESDFFAEPPR